MQMFSTLGFSVLYSTLALYITKGLGLEDSFAMAFTGSFMAFNYTLHVLGGYIGGRLLSYRALFIIGMLLQAAGCAIAAYPEESLLIAGTACFLTGCGLNVVCINCMLTGLFEPNDHRRESAFFWNYSGMNVGFFLGFTASGILQIRQDYQLLFFIASAGSLVSAAIAWMQWNHLPDRNTAYSQKSLSEKKQKSGIAVILIACLCVALYWLLEHPVLASRLVLVSGVAIAGLFVWFAYSEPNREASRKLWAFLVLTGASFIFWILYQMAPMSLSLFFDRNVDRVVWGVTIPPQWMMNINTFVIVFGGPVMARINHWLRTRGHAISIPGQFSAALFLIGGSFLLLPLGIYFADAAGLSAIGWLMGCYFFTTVGELCISPVGYAMIGNLIGAEKQGIAMGAWMMSTGVAAVIAEIFSTQSLGPEGIVDPLVTNPYFSKTFFTLGLFAILGGIAMCLLIRLVRKWIRMPSSQKEETPAPYNAPQD